LFGLVVGGGIVTTVLGLLSDRLGIQVLLLGLGVTAFTAAGLAAWLLPSTEPTFTERKFRGIMIAVGNLLVEAWRFNPLHLYHRFSLRRLPGLRRQTKVFLLASFLAFTGIGFFAVPLVLLLSQKLGYSPSMVFFGYVFLHSGIVLAYPFALHRIRRKGNRQVQIGALSARLVLFVLAGGLLWTDVRIPWAAAVPFLFLVGTTWSFFQLSGVALASRLAAPENRGLALGTYNAVAGASAIIAGVGSGYLAQLVGHHATYLVSATLLFLAVIVLGKLPDPVFLRLDTTAGNPTASPLRSQELVRDAEAGDGHEGK